MAERFELRTRHQFAGLIERRDRWVRMREQPEARERFEELTGAEWAELREGIRKEREAIGAIAIESGKRLFSEGSRKFSGRFRKSFG